MHKKSVKVNFVMNFIKTLMSLLFPLITFPYASRILLVEGIGQANYVASIISYFQMFAALGISTYAITEGAKIRDEPERLNRFASEILSLNLVSMLLSYFFFFLTLQFSFFEHYRSLLLLSSVSIVFTTLGVEWIYSIQEDYQYITIRSILFQILSLILLFVFVKTKDDVLAYVALTVISSVGSGILNFFHSRKYVKLKLVPLTKEVLKRHLKPILIIFGMTISTTIYCNSDVLLLGLMKGDTAVGFYTTAVKINQIVVALICSVSTVLLPRLSYYVTKKNDQAFHSLVYKSINLMLIFIIPMIFGLFLLSKEAILMIAGDHFIEASATLQVFAFNIFFSPLNNFLAYQILMPLRREKYSFIATLVGASANLILNFIFIPWMSFQGAAITTLLSEMIVFGICLFCVRDQIKIKNLFSNLYQYVLASLPICLICLVLRSLLSNHFYWYVIVSIGLSGLCYFGILFLLKNELLLEGIALVKRRVFHKGVK